MNAYWPWINRISLIQTVTKRYLKKRMMGQPTPLSHPSILREGEVLPNIKKSEFAERRLKLMNAISHSDSGMTNKNHVVIVPASPVKYRYGHIPFKYYQNPDFLYLCGSKEPESVLVLESTESYRLPNHRSVLYLQPRDDFRELWDGPRTGPEDALDLLGVDEAHPIDELESDLSEKYAKHGFTVWHYCSSVVDSSLQERIAKAMNSSPNSSIHSVHSFCPYLDAVRVLKSEAEVKMLRKACDISAEAFKEVDWDNVMQFFYKVYDSISLTIKVTRPNMWEFQLESTMEHASIMRGAYSLSFPPVVAGGDRGCHIHYIRNDNLLSDGELVLMDAGADYYGYMSDITRTWPVNGKFSSSQEDLYGSLLELQQWAIQKCKVGMSLNYLHHLSSEKMGLLLTNLGIVSPRLSSSDLLQAVDKLYPHHISHYLGTEVHDSPSVSRNVQLEPQMVVTVEPGIYIPSNFEDSGYAGPNIKHFKGMAIRIEDNVLITSEGNEVLSRDTPKEINELTQLMS